MWFCIFGRAMLQLAIQCSTGNYTGASLAFHDPRWSKYFAIHSCEIRRIKNESQVESFKKRKNIFSNQKGRLIDTPSGRFASIQLLFWSFDLRSFYFRAMGILESSLPFQAESPELG